jgi:hypothetical protein
MAVQGKVNHHRSLWVWNYIITSNHLHQHADIGSISSSEMEMVGSGPLKKRLQLSGLKKTASVSAGMSKTDSYPADILGNVLPIWGCIASKIITIYN